MAHPSRTIGVATGAAALLAMAAAVAGPPDPPRFGGKLAEGEQTTLDLPAGAKGTFWRVVLEGGRGMDLDLRVARAKPAKDERAWSSATDGSHEEVLVPAHEALKATIEHFGGKTSDYSLRLTAVTAAAKLGLGKAVAGEAGQGPSAFQVHEVPPSTKFTLVSLAPTVEAEGLDLDLLLHDAAFKLTNVSAGEAAEEQLVLSPSARTRWLVVHAAAGHAGYELSWEAVGEDAKRLALDEPATATLEADAEVFFRLKTTKPGIVTVRLEGPKGKDLDLRVYGPDGYYRESLAEDADEEISINGARRGDYLVHVVGGDPETTGDFTLQVEQLDVSRLAQNGKGGPRTWGLFVGIAAYEGVDALTYTASDALTVYHCLRQVGDADPKRSVVLLDELARKKDVVGALETIAARADEDDTFVFYYSGHGGNDLVDGERDDPKDEEDGGDEYLVCQDSGAEGADGDISDDELKGLLQRIKCRTQLLVIDACHSGGLAEVVEREGQWALFSSLETQVSSEALSKKNGLMTHLVVEGLEGAADADHDGRVTAAELGAHIERLQPALCPTCQATLGEKARRCRACGEALTGENQRQVPVITSKLAGEVVLSRPPKRAPR